MTPEPRKGALVDELTRTIGLVGLRDAPTPAPQWLVEELSCAWRAAQGEAVAAYEHWRQVPGEDAYAVYRASQDRADAAQTVLQNASASAAA